MRLAHQIAPPVERGDPYVSMGPRAAYHVARAAGFFPEDAADFPGQALMKALDRFMPELHLALVYNQILISPSTGAIAVYANTILAAPELHQSWLMDAARQLGIDLSDLKPYTGAPNRYWQHHKKGIIV